MRMATLGRQARGIDYERLAHNAAGASRDISLTYSEEALSFSTQQILLDLAAAGHRELVDEEDAARDLEAGDAAAAEAR